MCRGPVSALLVVGMLTAFSPRVRVESERTLDIVPEGEYLREDYVAALCESYSPLKADRRGDDPQLLWVGLDALGCKLIRMAWSFTIRAVTVESMYHPYRSGN